jgi:hypothetical protein
MASSDFRTRRRRGTVRREDLPSTVDGVDLKSAKLLELEEPRFLSVVKTPANRKAFKIVRGEDGDVLLSRSRRRRHQTEDMVVLDLLPLSLVLPYETAEEDVGKILAEFGLPQEQYEVVRTDTALYLKRKQIVQTASDNEPRTVSIPVRDGLVVTVDGAQAEALLTKYDNASAYLSLDRVVFASDNRETAEAWLAANAIAYAAEDLIPQGDKLVLVRHDRPKTAISETTALDDNVTVVISRADVEDDLPFAIRPSIINGSYGSDGWGHTFFVSAIADKHYTTSVETGVELLQCIVRRTLLHSGEEPEMRARILKQVLDEFYAWAELLLSALPIARIVSAQRGASDNAATAASRNDDGGADNSSKRRAATMPANDKQKDSVARDDAVADATGDDKDTDPSSDASTDELIQLTTVQLGEIVEESINEVLNRLVQAGGRPFLNKDASGGFKAHEKKWGPRSTIGHIGTPTAVMGKRGSDTGAVDSEPLDDITKAVAGLAQVVASLQTRMDAQDKSIKEVTEHVAVRADSDDAEADDAVARPEHDPFRNSFLPTSLTRRMYGN